MGRQARTVPTRYPGVEVVQDGRLYRVRISYTDPRTGRRKEKDRIVEAANAREASEVRAVLRHESGATPQIPRFREHALSWLRGRLASGRIDADSTGGSYAAVLDSRVLPRWGDYFCDKVTLPEVREWVLELSSEVGASRVRNVLTVFRQVMDSACVTFSLPFLPRQGLRDLLPVPSTERADVNRLAEDDLARALLAVRESEWAYAPAIWLMATTTLRWAHVRGLRWTDLTGDVLRPVRKWYCGKVGPITRRKNAPTAIRLAPEMVAMLEAYRSRMGSIGEDVFTGEMFPNLAPRDLAAAWRRSQDRAGIARPCSLHGIRHTGHDVARRAGVADATMMALAGHSTSRMHAHYSRASAEELGQVGREVSALVTRLMPEVGTPAGTEVGTAAGNTKRVDRMEAAGEE